ncbi:MAG: VacJ family lipoprotein [Alphaproteobacteria bacterium]|nr:VacJ family lipoprotein [Alphaproteobacteria bacterium]
MLNSVSDFRFFRFAIALTLMGALTACATPPSGDADARAAYEEANDPFEPANRMVFAANVMLDQLVLQPTAVTYRDLFPDDLKPPVENFITNLFMPLSFLHALLQGDMDRAERAAARFFTALPTLLLADTFPDEAPVFEDAGQTLATWGFEEGPYIMLPLLGPSSVRDTLGTVTDFFVDPVGIVADSEVTIGRAAGNAIVPRSRNLEQVRELQRTSLDYYAAVRSLHRQQRAAKISNGAGTPVQSAPTIGLDLDSPSEDEGKKETAATK